MLRTSIVVLLTTLAAAPALANDAHIVSFGGHGTTEAIVLRGRALAGKPSSDGGSGGRIRKLASTAHAFLRNDLEHVEIVVTGLTSGRTHIFRTDDDGFYDVRIPGPFPPEMQRFRIQLGGRYKARAVDVMIRPVAAGAPGTVIVCDIDDTIVHTGVTDGKLAVAASTAGKNATDMKPIPGAAATLSFFANQGVPVIYVTAGPVELAHRTASFLSLGGFPAGAMFFRRYEDDGIGAPLELKRRHIGRVMTDYPGRELVLIGDNGEQDPEIFGALAQETGRVAAIFIRTTRPATQTESRYAGATLFARWSEVRQNLGPRLIPRRVRRGPARGSRSGGAALRGGPCSAWRSGQGFRASGRRRRRVVDDHNVTGKSAIIAGKP